MFEKYTDRARKVMSCARHEAERLNHGYIGTEHILIGLIREDIGIASRVLTRGLHVDLARVRAEVLKLRPKGPPGVEADTLPFNPRSRCVLEHAQQEAVRLGHDYIGTEHLLLGLLRCDKGTGAEVLESLGLERAQVARQVLEVLSAGMEDPLEWEMKEARDRVVDTPWPGLPCLPERETDDVLAFSLIHAAQIGANEVEPLHLLHSLLQESCPTVTAALGNLGIGPGTWPSLIARSRVPGEVLGPGEIQLAPPTSEVLARAAGHGQRREPMAIGACELLLGLIDWGPQLFGWLLQDTGVQWGALRHEVLDLVGADASGVATRMLQQPPTVDRALQTLSPPAREALDHAIEEARRRGASEVGAEHLLLGLARPSSGGAAAILETMGAFPEEVRARIEASLGAPREPLPAPPPLSPEVEWVLGFAHNEAQRLGQGQVGTEALLMGVLWNRHSAAAQVLSSLEITLHRTRIALSSIRDTKRITVPPESRIAGTVRLGAVLSRSVWMLVESPALLAGWWHLLVALAESEGGLGPRALRKLGVCAPEVLSAAKQSSPTSPAESRQILMSASWAARQQGVLHPGSDTVLLSLIESPTAAAGAWLRGRGVSVPSVQAALAPLVK